MDLQYTVSGHVAAVVDLVVATIAMNWPNKIIVKREQLTCSHPS